MKIFNYLVAALSLVSSNAFSHGMSSPGPHGGEIKMPGTFHTELVFVNPKHFKVYLLDLHFKNPITKNSTVEAKLEGNKISNISCKKENDFFLCQLKTGIIASDDQILLTANRDNKKGTVVKYSVPAKPKS